MNDRFQDRVTSYAAPSERDIERRLLDYYDLAEQPDESVWSRLAPSLPELRATQRELEPQAPPSIESSPAEPSPSRPGLGLLVEERAGDAEVGDVLGRQVRSVPHRAGRRAIIAAGLLVAIFLAGGAYAAAPWLSRVFWSDPGAQQAAITNLGRRVDIARSAGGYTMTLHWVYADANRAIVGYRIEGPAGHKVKKFDLGPPYPALTDANGRSLPWHGGASPDLWPGSAEELVDFDASAITDQPSELRLHLVVPQISVIEDTYGSPYDRFVVSGPWVFDFTAPFHAGRTLEPHQAVTNNGHTISLDRAVLTPSETRLSFRGMPADVIDRVDSQWVAWISISVAGSGKQWLGPSAGQGGLMAESRTTADGLWLWSTPTPLIDKHGRWTVTLTFEPVTTPGDAPNSPPKPIVAGPLTFQFDVP